MNTARNEPCPCGSGRRYKHCCGVVIPISASAMPAPTVAAPDVSDDGYVKPDPGRSCGTCTACCDGWLTATIRGHEMGVGKPCHFRAAAGCTIYEDRPENPCRAFFCAWRMQGIFPDSFRPDRLGVLILVKQWRDRIAYYLAPAGREADSELLEWMRRLSTASGSPFLAKVNGRDRGYGSTEFQQDLLDKASRGEPPLPGLNPISTEGKIMMAVGKTWR